MADIIHVKDLTKKFGIFTAVDFLVLAGGTIALTALGSWMFSRVRI